MRNQRLGTGYIRVLGFGFCLTNLGFLIEIAS